MEDRRKMEWQDLGEVPYREALALQETLREKRIAGEIADRLLILTHPPVFTLGKRGGGDDFVSSREAVAKDGIEIVETDRGGRVTYHGPGQIVGYFIAEVDHLGGVKKFVSSIEEIIIRTVKDYGIVSSRDAEHPGVWCGNLKIAAIGLNISHGVTLHGFALNVDMSLDHYRHIIACGIRDRGITTMALAGGDSPKMGEVKDALIRHSCEVLGRSIVRLVQS